MAGFQVPKGDNELSLGEIGTRIDEIRASDPAAPARRLATIYHMRVALSGTPIVLAVVAMLPRTLTASNAAR